MPVYKCPNGKYRIGSGKCMYATKKKADNAYAAYLAITHSEQDVATQLAGNVLRRIRNLRKKKKVKKTKKLPFAGSKLRSKGKGQGLAIGKGAGPIGRMKQENIMRLTKCHSVCLKDSAGFDPKEYKIAKGGLMNNGKCIPSSVLVIWGKLKEAKEGARHIVQALYFPMGKFTVSSMKAFLEKNKLGYIFLETGAKNKLAEVVAGAKQLSTYPKEIPLLARTEAFLSIRAALEKAVSYKFGPDAFVYDFSTTEVIVGYSKSDTHPINSYESGEYEKTSYKVVKGEIKFSGMVSKVTKLVSYEELSAGEWKRLWEMEAKFVEKVERIARICRVCKT